TCLARLIEVWVFAIASQSDVASHSSSTATQIPATVIQRFIEIECTQNLTTPVDLSFPETGFITL
ncbi:MAG: hypothetical protein ACTMK5_13390, partial [Pseudomonas helleri]